GGVCAVVPCQWRRIIGSYFTVTRGNLKKSFRPCFFFTNSGEIKLQIVLFDVSTTTITFEVA
ncbi:hypothetical protein OB912_18215, partial [Enterobacter kobei]|nr:hypothetical protein [Enterobacter kobei]